MKDICKDLFNEQAALDDLVKELDRDDWQTVTPFYGWTIKDEISHLAYFDRAAFLCATDVEAFTKDVENMLEGFTDYDNMHDKVNSIGRNLSDTDLLLWWRKERAQLLKVFETLDPKTRLPWYGPSMSAKSCVTARLMETWAHGQDIVDALKASRPGTDRLMHIAHIGVSTFEWSFNNRKIKIPSKKVRVELFSPSGKLWAWGPEDAANIVRGTAQDFCLVVTQRRNVTETKIISEGEIASQWMSIAQAFAGPPEDGPE